MHELWSLLFELLLSGRIDATLNAEVTYYDYIQAATSPPPEDFFSSSFVPIAVTPLYELPVRKVPRRRWPGA